MAVIDEKEKEKQEEEEEEEEEKEEEKEEEVKKEEQKEEKKQDTKTTGVLFPTTFVEALDSSVLSMTVFTCVKTETAVEKVLLCASTEYIVNPYWTRPLTKVGIRSTNGA